MGPELKDLGMESVNLFVSCLLLPEIMSYSRFPEERILHFPAAAPVFLLNFVSALCQTLLDAI